MSAAALLVDGTALFLASRAIERERNLDYLALDERLKAAAHVQSFDLALFFTSFDPNNEGQRKFLDFVAATLKWTVDRVHANDAMLRTTASADVPNLSSFVRFDARIAFCLGRLAGRYEQVVVVSDSYALAAPMLETVERQTRVTLAFFGQLLDPRWAKVVHKAAPPVVPMDLDKDLVKLFGGDPSKNAVVADSGLRRLP